MGDNTRYGHKIKRKRKRRLRKSALIFALLLLSVVGYFVYVVFNTYTAANEAYDGLERGNKSNLRDKEVKISEDPVSILVMGVEDYSTGGANGRTDSLMLITLNPKDQTMKMLSIPRDSRVDIIGKGFKDKINHAYAYGGKDMTIETVEHFLDIPIDYYVTMSFDGFKNIIDEIGGVPIDIPFDFWEKSDEGIQDRIYFKKGKANLNGEEALAYARMRKRDPRGDMGRNDRQQQVFKAVMEKIISPTMLFKVDEVARQIGSNVQTNIRISEAVAMSTKLSGFKTSKIEKLTITGVDDYIDRLYYFIPDEENLEEVTSELKSHLNK